MGLHVDPRPAYKTWIPSGARHEAIQDSGSTVPRFSLRMNATGKIYSSFNLRLGKRPFCPSTCQLGGPRSWSGRAKEEKTFLFLPRTEPRFLGRPAFSLVTNRTKLSRLMLDVVMNIKFRLSRIESNFCRPVHSPPIQQISLLKIFLN
jgi:hypothetical protein